MLHRDILLPAQVRNRASHLQYPVMSPRTQPLLLHRPLQQPLGIARKFAMYPYLLCIHLRICKDLSRRSLCQARLYRLALEKGSPGARYHAVGDEGVPTRQIAEAIGRHLHLPVESLAAEKANEHFGFLGMFFGLDAPATAHVTSAELGWAPREPGLLSGLATDAYYQGASKY